MRASSSDSRAPAALRSAHCATGVTTSSRTTRRRRSTWPGSTATSCSAPGTTPCSTASTSSSRAPACPTRRRRCAPRAPRGSTSISEIELGARLLDNRILGVTGTNGKTTTTALLGAMFDAAGIAAEVVGNIGRPLTSLVGTVDPDAWVVCELSSFQLEDVDTLRPRVALLEPRARSPRPPRHLRGLRRREAAHLRESDGDDVAVVPAASATFRARRGGSSSRATTRCPPSRSSRCAQPRERRRRGRRRACRRPRRRGDRRGAAHVPGRRAPDRGGRDDRRRALRQRLQGDERRRRAPRSRLVPGRAQARDPRRPGKAEPYAPLAEASRPQIGPT